MNRLLPLKTISTLRRRKRPVLTVATSVKIPRSLDRAIKLAARKEGITQSLWIRRCLAAQINFLNAEVK